MDTLARFAGTAAVRGMFAGLFDGAAARPRRGPETTGETGHGVWAVVAVDEDGSAQVEQVSATEIDALRVNQHNTDVSRRVRFLLYGIVVSALDD